MGEVRTHHPAPSRGKNTKYWGHLYYGEQRMSIMWSRILTNSQTHFIGNRYWLWGILQVATRTFHAQDENVTGMTYLSQGWDKEFPIRPGDFQAPATGVWLDNSAWCD